MKKNQSFSDTTLLVSILREYFDTSRKEVTTELILQRFTAAINEQTTKSEKGTTISSNGRKKRQRESVNPPLSSSSVNITNRYLIALSELQRLGYLRLTSSGHQIKKLMVNLIT